MSESDGKADGKNAISGMSGIDRISGSKGNNEDSPSHDSKATHQPQASQASYTSQKSQKSQVSQPSHQILRPRGDYRNLLSFQKAEVIYDITFRFAHKFLARGDRTIDQMVQSARSGKKNILEGSKAAITSRETEIKLTNVARASLEELLDDYVDYLRARDHAIWDKESAQAQFVRNLGRVSPQTFELYREFVETRPAETIANIAICLIHQANYLIDRQLQRIEQEFVLQGGLRERMTRVRLEHREKQR
jgi:four helix bundle suffix protein